MPNGDTPTNVQNPVDAAMSSNELEDAYASALATGESEEVTDFSVALDAAYAINQQWRPVEERQNRAALRSAHHVYFRMCPDQGCLRHRGLDSGINERAGWITIGPDRASNSIEHTRYIEDKHMTPLPEYGRMPVGMLGASNASLRFKALLEHPSGRGIFEIPLTQLAAYGWDKIPEVRAIRTDCETITRISCGHGCVNRSFLTDDQYKVHIQAKHAEVASSVAIGEAVKGAVALNQQAFDPTQLATAVVAVIQQLNTQAAAEGSTPPTD
jgi:hypothetical protein